MSVETADLQHELKHARGEALSLRHGLRKAEQDLALAAASAQALEQKLAAAAVAMDSLEAQLALQASEISSHKLLQAPETAQNCEVTIKVCVEASADDSAALPERGMAAWPSQSARSTHDSVHMQQMHQALQRVLNLVRKAGSLPERALATPSARVTNNPRTDANGSGADASLDSGLSSTLTTSPHVLSNARGQHASPFRRSPPMSSGKGAHAILDGQRGAEGAALCGDALVLAEGAAALRIQGAVRNVCVCVCVCVCVGGWVGWWVGGVCVCVCVHVCVCARRLANRAEQFRR
jgi:hypothetical protein